MKSVLSVVRCAVHTLQLAAHDVYKTVHTELAECREAVRCLRKLIRTGLFQDEIKMPTLDSITRWNSTYDMLTSMLDLKDFANDHQTEPNINWNFIQNFVGGFKPVAECTKSLQTENYIIGDFYRDWLLCEAKLESVQDNTFAISLLTAMQSRKIQLFENNAFIAALYMDRRFNYIDSLFLTEAQKREAIVSLLLLINFKKQSTFRSGSIFSTSHKYNC